MTARDRKYGGRTITLPQDVAARLEAYRASLEKELGAKVNYHMAIMVAIKRATTK